MKINHWRKEQPASGLVLCGIFLLMLVCNGLTLYMVDDFAYMYSFSTRERIDSILDIIPSMLAHARTMNGRLAAHALVQLSLMLPGWVFDIINSAAFCLLVKRLSNITGQKKDTWLMHAGVFCALWLFVPAFGQVVLWQDGAINYLWAVVLGILFLCPFISRFMNEDSAGTRKKPAVELGFLIFSFVVGAYSESVSAAVIFMAAMLTVLDAWMNRRKMDLCRVSAVVVAFAGYLTIYLAPAQWANKGQSLTLSGLLNNIIDITLKYQAYLPLLILAAILFTVNIMKKSDPKKIVLAAVLFLGAMAANYIMAFAVSYPSRCAFGTVAFHIAADVVLMEAISREEEYRIKNTCVIAVLVMLTIPHLLIGLRSIGATWRDMRINEQVLVESAEKGMDYVEIYMIYPDSEYSALCGLKYLDRKDADSWPNDSMAKYYGVDAILGVLKEE